MLYLSSLGMAILTTTALLSGSRYLPPEKPVDLPDTHQHCDHQHHSGEHYSSPGKPGTAIAQLDKSQFAGLLGETLELSLALQSPLHEGELRVAFSADSALEMTQADTVWQFSLNQPIPEIPLTVTAHEAGAHYVHLTVEHWLNGNLSHARALAVEVTFKTDNTDVPAKLYEKSFNYTEAPTVISLPAVETIR